MKGVNYSTELLKLGGIKITYGSLLTIEENVTEEEKFEIRSCERSFRVGWLTDDIIESFLCQLQQQYTNVIVCGATEALAIIQSKSIRLLWKGVDLSTKDLVLVPFNPSNSHWTCLLYTSDAADE